MTEPLVPTIAFSPAKAHLSDVMDAVFHQHRLQVVSRHRGKEQMLLVRPEPRRRFPAAEILITRVSRSGKKTMSPGRFSAILSDQLKVSAAQFWDVIRSKEPAERPSPDTEHAPKSLPLWLAQQLERAGVTSEAIEVLDEGAARAFLDKIRSRPAR